MSGYDLLLCEMSLPDPRFGPETLFLTRAFRGVFSELYVITADGHLLGPFDDVSLLAGATGSASKALASCGEEDPSCTFNGDIEFWANEHLAPTFFACFIDGRCVRILEERCYRELMVRARRWALAQLA